MFVFSIISIISASIFGAWMLFTFIYSLFFEADFSIQGFKYIFVVDGLWLTTAVLLYLQVP